ncbi:MAG TPA: sigma-70 family RNA polymerase sigma factor [Candidatus Angelobacter sp.]|nr:sigma-70 family RNA polymerase sigma factor [Candidatus Angelobacter sp.]
MGETSASMESVLADIYIKSKCELCGLSRAQFDNILAEIGRKYLPADSTQNEVCDFYASLRVEELALARACATGNEHAWEVFLTRYREKLYEIAGYITKESSTARELADSIYADLYGTVRRDGERASKLASYTGRGSLEGWLRTVMAQEHVNRYRRQRRLVSLDEEAEEGAQFATAEPETAIVADPRVEGAVDEVLAALGPEERFVLASYFLDERTLADIARSLGVHESTISRKLDKLAKSLRKQILASLGRRGMSRRQAQEALEVDVRDLRVNIRSRLAQETGRPAFSKKKAETPAGDGS